MILDHSTTETFKVCVAAHVATRMFIMQVLSGQLIFLANSRKADSVNCIKIKGHVALLSDPTVSS